jgi:hypothetical protein
MLKTLERRVCPDIFLKLCKFELATCRKPTNLNIIRYVLRKITPGLYLTVSVHSLFPQTEHTSLPRSHNRRRTFAGEQSNIFVCCVVVVRLPNMLGTTMPNAWGWLSSLDLDVRWFAWSAAGKAHKVATPCAWIFP